MSKIKKALIPAAGLGTRFLPATKTVPKEMLTIVDAPIILYVVEEAIQAGVEDIVLIAGRGKHAIEDFFDSSYELEDKLARENQTHLLERLTKVRNQANIISIRQKQALGLGHAVLCGAPVIGNEPFAVLLGDEITTSEGAHPSLTSQLCRIYEETQNSVVSIMSVEDKDVSKVLSILPKDARYYFSNAHIERALPHNDLKEKAKAFGLSGESFDDVNEAINAAKLNAASDDIIIVCGSVFLVAEVETNLFKTG